MAVYWITFRIEDETSSGRTYDQRYEALIEALNEHAGLAWEESTSFYIFSSASSQAVIAASVGGAISRKVDVALIGSMDTVGATLVGNAKELAALKRLIPDLVVS